MKKLVGAALVVLVVVVAWFAWHRQARTSLDRPEGRTGSGAIVAGRGPASAALPASIAGRVINPAGGGIAGAVVSLSKAEFDLGAGSTGDPLIATSDANGAWIVAKLPPGRYTANAQARGFVPGHTEKLVVASGEQRSGVVITLAAGGTVLSGTVSDVGGGPIAEAHISIHPDAASPLALESYVAIADKDGHYEATLADGGYDLVADHDDYTARNENVEIAGSPVTQNFVLTPGGVIRGVVIARDTSKPVAGAVVIADVRHDRDKRALQPTDADGAFTIRGVHPGAVQITAGGRGYASAQPTTVELGIGEQVEHVRVIVDKAYTISGTVVKRGTKDGIPNLGVGAFAMSAGTGSQYPANAPSDEKGRWEIYGVRPGTFTLFAFGEAVVPNVGKSVTVGNKDLGDVELEIEAGVTIAGKVTPPQGAVVTIELAGEVGIANMFDAIKTFLVHGDADPATGAFTLHNVPAGAFKLVARATAGSVGKLPITITAADQRDVVVPLEVRASLSGKVIDTTGAAISGANVSAKRIDDDHQTMVMFMGANRGGATSRADGTFKLLALEAGEYEVHATRHGDDLDRMVVALGAADKTKKLATYKLALGDDKTGVVVMVPAENGVIRGQVQDSNSQPVADTWVTARRMPSLPASVSGKTEGLADEMSNSEWWTSSEPVLTGGDGKFTISKLSDDQYLVVAEGPRGASRAEKKAKPGETITLQLAALGSLTGHVTSAGAPVVGYSIECKGPAGSVDRSSAASDGAYSLEHLAPGAYACHVDAEAGTAAGKITVPAGPATLELALTPWSTLTGQIVNMFDHTVLANIAVAASSSNANMGAYMVDAMAGNSPKSDASGHFVINKVALGKGQVLVLDSTGFKPLATKDYEVANGQRVDLGVIEIVPPRTGEAGTFGMSTEPGTEGLSITQLKEGGPAAAAGLVVGDVITSLAGQPIKTKQPLVQTYLSSGSIGVGVTIQLGLARGTTVAVTSVKW